MANKTSKKEVVKEEIIVKNDEIQEEEVVVVKQKELNMNDTTFVTNPNTWAIAYKSISTGQGVRFDKKQTLPIKNEELYLLFSSDNSFYTGKGKGHHARLIVNDGVMKQYLIQQGFLDKEQIILDKRRVESIIKDSKTLNQFRDNLDIYITDWHEARFFCDTAKEIGLKDYDFIRELKDRYGYDEF